MVRDEMDVGPLDRGPVGIDDADFQRPGRPHGDRHGRDVVGDALHGERPQAVALGRQQRRDEEFRGTGIRKDPSCAVVVASGRAPGIAADTTAPATGRPSSSTTEPTTSALGRPDSSTGLAAGAKKVIPIRAMAAGAAAVLSLRTRMDM